MPSLDAEIAWQDWLRGLGPLDLSLLDCLPDFLVMAPPKTGTTWLGRNLERHPQLFVPVFKELKYFCTYWRHRDLNWYLRFFQDARDRIKGEATPTYAILPPRAIRLLKTLRPNLKLLYLMREPMSRAWSHARHNHQYREANFIFDHTPLAEVRDEAFRQNFVHAWNFAQGDYQSHLETWLQIFPPSQLYLTFYERIPTQPEALLNEAFHFLGVDNVSDWKHFRTKEVILEGEKHPLSPSLARWLRTLLQPRTRRLATYLEQTFGLSLPPAWALTLEGEVIAEPLLLEEHPRGYRIYFHQGDFVALHRDRGLDSLEGVGATDRPEVDGSLRGSSLLEVTYLLDRAVFSAPTGAGFRPLQAFREELQAQRLELLLPDRFEGPPFPFPYESPALPVLPLEAHPLAQGLKAARGLLEAQAPGQARDLLHPLLALYPASAEAHLLLGEALQAEGDLAGAVRAWRTAAMLDERLEAAWRGLFLLALALGPVEVALSTLEAWRSRFPLSDEALLAELRGLHPMSVTQAELLYDLATAVTETAEERALLGGESVDLTKPYAAVLRTVAQAMWAQGERSRAIHLARRSLELVQDQVELVLEAADWLSRLGAREQALRLAQGYLRHGRDPRVVALVVKLGGGLSLV